MAVELPPVPVPLQNETPAEFNDRMLNWWRMCDILLRQECQQMKSQWLENVVPQFQPTLIRIADAWDAMDTRLGELATALSGQPSPAPAGSDAARVVVSALMAENTDRPPAEVATAVLARVAAVDSMLGGEPA